MTDERVMRILNDLSSLIASHSGMLAREMYRPCPGPDESDEFIRDKIEFVTELRDIRERFENVVTGIGQLTAIRKPGASK